MWARSSAAGAGNAVPGWASMRGSSTSMTVRSHPSSRSARPAVVTAAIGAASATMNPIRAAGAAGSIGRYAAPVLSTATIAMIASTDRENSSPTHAPGPAPYPVSKCANRFDASSSSRYVHAAAAAGQRHRLRGAGHLRGEQHRNRDRALTGSVNTARLPISSSPACSPASSRSTSPTTTDESATTASITRPNRRPTARWWPGRTDRWHSSPPPRISARLGPR